MVTLEDWSAGPGGKMPDSTAMADTDRRLVFKLNGLA
jgi:hypothetical protein